MNAHDDDIERYLKLLTLLELEEIKNIVLQHRESPELRTGQKKLAYEVVNIIHWKTDAESCQKITEFLFGWGDKIELLKDLNEEEFKLFYTEIWGIEYSAQNLFGMFIESGLEQSWTTARQTLKGGWMFINEKKIEDGHYDFSKEFINEKFLLLRKGKKNFRIIKNK